MSVAPWRSLIDRALNNHRNITYARYFQLATVTADSRPANRTVVFRGFEAERDRLKVVTDIRSEKVCQIVHQPWAEACWYFPQTWEQFRLSGTLSLVKADNADISLQQARQASWQELSDAARLQFAQSSYPGKPRADAAAFSPPPPNPIEPLPNFCLLLLEPVQVDYLLLRGEPQNRWLYCRRDDSEWSVQEINP